MANLTMNDFKRHAGKPEGDRRLNAFINKFLAAKTDPYAKFLMVNGTKFLPTTIETQSEWLLKSSLRSKEQKARFKNDIKTGKITQLWLANNNDLIPISQLQKTLTPSRVVFGYEADATN